VKISVDRLFGADVDAIEVDQVVRPAGDLGERYPDGVRLAASIGRISHGVYMEGSIDGNELETCVRCLENFRRPTHIDVEETFSEDVAPSEAIFADVSPLVDRSIDIDALVAQLLEVDEPLAATCDARCKGICPMCGANRNVVSCTCEERIIDERLAGLSRFIQERESN
jgi:uncharacterized metal-binding protein YceD (DUF177 family)